MPSRPSFRSDTVEVGINVLSTVRYGSIYVQITWKEKNMMCDRVRHVARLKNMEGRVSVVGKYM